MKNEPFAKTMANYFFSEVSFFPDEETEHIKDVIYCFEIHGSFLDIIPIEDRTSIIIDIFRWLEGVWLNIYREQEKIRRNPKKPIKKIQDYLKTIEDMKKILSDEGLDGETILNIKNKIKN